MKEWKPEGDGEKEEEGVEGADGKVNHEEGVEGDGEKEEEKTEEAVEKVIREGERKGAEEEGSRKS